jgi:hypothetical protein
MRMIVLLLLTLAPAMLRAQDPSREELAREVDDYRRTVHAAASTFLSRDLPAAERIQAIEPHGVLYDQEQVEQFKAVVLDAREPAAVRAEALDRLVGEVPRDARLSQLVLQWLTDPREPLPLRTAALHATATLQFSSDTAPEFLQKLVDDPLLGFRVFAFTRLIIHGDPRAQETLIQGLEHPEQASVPARTAIAILSMAPKKEFYPAVLHLFRETRDDATRLEAIRLLGPYLEARPTLIAVSRDSNEKEELREAALGALYAGDREHIVSYVEPLLSSGMAPARLQAIGIQMTIDLRQAMAYRLRRKRADSYDRLIARLAREATDPDVRSLARQYLDSVRPPL